MTMTNKGFSVGITYEQGISFSENTGYFPMPEARTGTVLVLDDNDQPHVIVLDSRDGKFYDITTRNGPASTGMTREVNDKVDVSGEGGYDITPSVRFKEESGTLEKFFIQQTLSKVYLRPDDEDNRGAVGRDTSGYIDDIEFQTKTYVDGEPDTATATAEDIGTNGDIVYDRKVRGHRIQTEVSANKGGFRIVGVENHYITQDQPVAPDDRVTTEGDHQISLSSPLMWFSRGKLYTNRANGSKVSGSPVEAVGPEGGTSSAFLLSEAKEMGSIASTGAKTCMLWVSGGTTNVDVSIGGNDLSLINYDSSGSWYLMYASGITDSGSVVITPSTTNAVCDFRIHSGDKSDDLEYYFNDVTENNGDNVMPL